VNIILQKLGLSGGSALTSGLIFTALVVSFILGYILTLVYRKTHAGFSYEPSFNFTLIMMTVIISVIMLVIGSNIALSLGLIGSLSVIRFRAVIKDSKDMAYLFWAIATGLSVGSANYLVAVWSVTFISIVTIVLSKTSFSQSTNMDYIMVVQQALSQDDDRDVKLTHGTLDQCKVDWSIRSSLVDQNNSFAETTYSILFNKASLTNLDDLTQKIGNLKNVKKVTMLSPQTNMFT
jgi:uncharacterized membrane protein YhiD involved in acid resistance